MSDSRDLMPAGRFVRPIRWTMLTASLAAFLFVSYGVAVPLPGAWPYWWVPIFIATAGAVALLLAWPSRRAVARAKTASEVAIMLGVASTIVGLGAAMLDASGLAWEVADSLSSSQELLYRLTEPSFLIACFTTAMPAAITGGFGLVISGRCAGAARRVSMVGVARRFAAVGLASASLIAATAGSGAIYRWVTWG